MHALALLVATAVAAPAPVAVVAGDPSFTAGARAYLRGTNVTVVNDSRAVVALDDGRGAPPAGVPVLRFAPSPRLELSAIAAHVTRTRPDVVVAALVDLERGLVPQLREALGTRAPLVVVERLRDARAAGAGVVVNLTGRAVRPPPAWRLPVYATSVAVGTPAAGTITPVFVRNPGDPRWFHDPGLEPFRPAPSARYVAGLAAAFTLVEALERAGPAPTRATVARALRSLRIANNPFVLPGMILRTGPRDTDVVSQVALQRWDGRRWSVISGLISLR